MTVVSTRGTCLARALRVLACALTVLVAGCHTNTRFTPGTPVLTLQDTSGDFASYQIAISSITLTRTDGTIVTVLATPEVVDLVKLTDFAELLGAPAVASGTYSSAQITLSYISASIYINANGHAQLCNPVNPAGTALNSQAITVTFDPANPLVITQGKSDRVAIDIDLAASNSINASASPCVVTVQPFLTVRPAPVDASVLRARGLLVTTETGSSDFIINTRPLFDLVSGGLGAVKVNTTGQTYFNINGTTYTGAAGLAAMVQLTENTPIATYGTLADLSGITPTFNATAVYVGTSLESPLEDHVMGVVSARSGNTLTVRGVFYRARTGALAFADSASVTLGTGTIVSEDGVAAAGLSAASVSVGQQIDVAGQGTDNAGTITMDATFGQVRLASTRVWGTLNSATTGSLSLNALTFGNYAPVGFNFAGTGAGGQDATPAAYLVNTGRLDESATAAGALLAVDGFVAPFGAAPPDFNATAITPGAATQQKLVVEWINGGTPAPFTAASSAGFVVDLGNARLGTVHYITVGPTQTDLKNLPASPLITTVGADQSNLQLAIGSSALAAGVSVFSSAPAFATAVNSVLSSGHNLYRLVAVGQYESATNTFVASSISLALHE
jgi:hypothetical protein